MYNIILSTIYIQAQDTAISVTVKLTPYIIELFIYKLEILVISLLVSLTVKKKKKDALISYAI